MTTIADGSVWDGTTLSGVAPAAELWDYNVFPYFGAGMVAFGGSAFSHDIAAAIEDAVLDGMDVINMSLGGGVQGSHDFLAEASNAAVAAGVTVVTSAGFSSCGPAPFTNIVKPDVVAPGVNILSSVQGSGGILGTFGTAGWELYNGTSMASPHGAGAAAALLSENPGWTPAMVKSALVTTADASKPGLDVFEQGGGLVDLYAADMASTFFEPANASFGIMKGNKPANGSVEIAVSGGPCAVTGVTGSAYVGASIDGDTLTVSFGGGRDATTGFYGGYVGLDCDGANHHIPWGAVVNR